jgi:predicted DNA-binding transcriptional regulator AlpA
MKKKRIDPEVGMPEIAAICGVSRQMAWRWVLTGEIPGGRLVAGRVWVAPRSKVLAHARKRARLAAAARPVPKAGVAGAVEVIKRSMKRVSADMNAAFASVRILGGNNQPVSI